jgi:Uma2 family endonuclease
MRNADRIKEAMSSQPTTLLSPTEYLEQDRQAQHKSEYFQGQMFTMAGASPQHVLIVTNLVRELSQKLKGRPCRVYSSDLRLRVAPTGLYTYPDVMVVCGEAQFADDQKDTVMNPLLIIEVLSESTRDYDRGQKFQHYRTLPSLVEYLTVAQDVPHIEHWIRQPENRWLLAEFSGLNQSLQLASIGCVLPSSEVYEKIEWV